MSHSNDKFTAISPKKELKRKLKEEEVDVEETDTEKDTKKRDEVSIVKRKDVKKPSMPTYGKYNILKILKENHCLISDDLQRVLLSNAFPRNKRYDLDDIRSENSFINFVALN